MITSMQNSRTDDAAPVTADAEALPLVLRDTCGLAMSGSRDGMKAVSCSVACNLHSKAARLGYC